MRDPSDADLLIETGRTMLVLCGSAPTDMREHVALLAERVLKRGNEILIEQAKRR